MNKMIFVNWYFWIIKIIFVREKKIGRKNIIHAANKIIRAAKKYFEC